MKLVSFITCLAYQLHDFRFTRLLEHTHARARKLRHTTLLHTYKYEHTYTHTHTHTRTHTHRHTHEHTSICHCLAISDKFIPLGSTWVLLSSSRPRGKTIVGKAPVRPSILSYNRHCGAHVSVNECWTYHSTKHT